MKTSHRGFIVPLLLIIIAVLVVGGGAYVYVQQKPNVQSSGTQITFPPNGWHVHNSADIPALGTSVMLTKQKTYSKGFCDGTEWACYGEQINIHSSSITLTPEQYVTKIIKDGVFPSVQKWDTLNGYKIFSMTYTTEANDVSTDGLYLFVGDKVYQFSLYPSAEKNRSDFQQVITYYAKK